MILRIYKPGWFDTNVKCILICEYLSLLTFYYGIFHIPSGNLNPDVQMINIHNIIVVFISSAEEED